jgi:hypothetical protein
MKSCLFSLKLFADLMRFVRLTLNTSLAAENLFLRKQLAFYRERKSQASTNRCSNAA